MQLAHFSKHAKISKLNTAFFLCDIQERFRKLITNMDSVIHVGSVMTRASQVLNVPLFVTEQYPKALGHTVDEIKQHFEKDQKVFAKTKFSMMTDEFVKDFETKKVEHVVIFGIEAHVCVLQTTKKLLNDGYSVHICCDGVSSQRAFDRDIAFKQFQQLGASMTTSESILFEMLGHAKHENFKPISNLMKEKRPELSHL